MTNGQENAFIAAILFILATPSIADPDPPQTVVKMGGGGGEEAGVFISCILKSNVHFCLPLPTTECLYNSTGMHKDTIQNPVEYLSCRMENRSAFRSDLDPAYVKIFFTRILC